MKFFYRSMWMFALCFIHISVWSQTATIGAGSATGTSSNVGPIYRSSAASAFDWSQQYYLYTAAELSSAGIIPGSFINSVAFFKDNAFGTTAGNNVSIWKIYMKTSATAPSTTWSSTSFATQSSGATLCYDNQAQVIPTTAGWVTLTFSSPFLYSGGNLEIGSSWDCSLFAGNPTDGAFSWKRDPITNQVFGGSAGSSAVTMALQTARPQIQMTYTPAAGCSGQPVAGTTTSTASAVCPGVNFSVGLSGQTAASGISYQWQSSPTGSGYTNIVGATNSSYSTTQTVNTYYRCVTTCIASTLSDTSTPLLVTTNSFLNCYCTSTATSNADEDILNVSIGSLNNSSTCTTTGGAGSSTQMYSNYTALPAPQLTQLVSYPMTVQVGTCGTGNYSNWTKVYIDYNRNGLFTDAGEEVYSAAGANVGANLHSFNVNIPITSSVGVTRMRVITVETTVATGVTPCGTYTWGETEDYYVEIVANTLCNGQPTGGTTITSNSNPCPNVNYSLSLNGATVASGLTYQWQSSLTGSGYSNIAGATSAFYSTSTNTNIYYRCVLTCTNAALSDTSVPVMITVNSFQNCYCTSNATSTADEEILGVSIGTLNNTSTCTTTGGAGSIPSQYSNYTALPAPSLARTVGYPMTVNIGTCGTGSYNNMTKVYIDWNQNGLFTDAGEQVYVSPAATSGAHSESFVVNVPVGATLGTTRMRIVTVETTVAGNINPCGTYTWGETEDYFVQVFPVPTCPQPTALTVQGTTTTSASLDWTAGGAETVWQLQYGLQGFALGTGTIVNVSTSSDTVLGGLASYTFYDVYVRGICGAGDTSFWAPKKTFNTYGLGQYMEQTNNCSADGYIDMTTIGASNPLAADGEAGFVLPFTFYYQGTEVTSITVGNNGAVVFNTISAQINPGNANTLATSADLGLYPFWDDLDDTGGNVYYGSVGAAPNRRFVVQWVKKQDLFQAGIPFDFELIMEESTGKVYFQYANTVTGSATYDNGASATIGLAGPLQDFPLSFNNAAYLQTNTCVEFYYTNCPKPVNLITNYITPDEASFNWSAGLYGETNWTVIYGPAGFDPLTGGIVQTTTSPFITLIGLTQLTQYDVYIYADCSVGNQSFALKTTFITKPYCSDPTGVTASTAIDSLFSNWSWTAFSPMYPNTGFDLLYGTTGFDTLTGGTIVHDDAIVGDTVYDMNFMGGGVYQLYVRGVCDTLVSRFIGPITFTMPLTNDTVCGAEMLQTDGTVYVFNNAGATVSAGENAIAPPVTGAQSTTGWLNNTLSFTTWFKFVAPASGNVRISGVDRGFNGQIAVYDASLCANFGSFTLVAANDDAIGGGSLAPNFTVCGLTPGVVYFLMHDSFSTSATGIYSIKINSITLNAGTATNLIKVCSKDTVNLFAGISGYQAGGVWNDLDGTFHIVNDTLFNTNGLAYQTYQFEYRLTDGCATDGEIATFQVYPPSQAGTDGAITICKNEPTSLTGALGGTFSAGGQWYNASGVAIANGNIPYGGLSVPGTYNYKYVVGNGVCPNDTSIVTVSVLANCDFTGLDDLNAGGFKVYPNPTTGVVNVQFMNITGESNLEVRDMHGRLLAELPVNNLTENLTVDLSNYDRGMYFLNLSGSQLTARQRVVKN